MFGFGAPDFDLEYVRVLAHLTLGIQACRTRTIVPATSEETHNVPFRIEGIDAYELVLLGRRICVLHQ